MTATSPISQVIASLTNAMEATRTEVAGIDAQIEAAEQERQRVNRAPPHATDIARAFMRGLERQAIEFRSQLASSLAETFVAAENAAQASTAPAHLLTVEPHQPSMETLRTRTMSGEAAPLNMAALTYLLRDRIAEDLPELIDKLCPQARGGMKQSDREAALAALDGKLAELRAARDAMQADLNAARQAALGRRDQA